MYKLKSLLFLSIIAAITGLVAPSLAQYEDYLDDLYVRDADPDAEAEPYAESFPIFDDYEDPWTRRGTPAGSKPHIVCTIPNQKIEQLVKADERREGAHWDDKQRADKEKQKKAQLSQAWKKKGCYSQCKCGDDGKMNVDSCPATSLCKSFCKCASGAVLIPGAPQD